MPFWDIINVYHKHRCHSTPTIAVWATPSSQAAPSAAKLVLDATSSVAIASSPGPSSGLCCLTSEHQHLLEAWRHSFTKTLGRFHLVNCKDPIICGCSPTKTHSIYSRTANCYSIANRRLRRNFGGDFGTLPDKPCMRWRLWAKFCGDPNRLQLLFRTRFLIFGRVPDQVAYPTPQGHTLISTVTLSSQKYRANKPFVNHTCYVYILDARSSQNLTSTVLNPTTVPIFKDQYNFILDDAFKHRTTVTLPFWGFQLPFAAGACLCPAFSWGGFKFAKHNFPIFPQDSQELKLIDKYWPCMNSLLICQPSNVNTGEMLIHLLWCNIKEEIHALSWCERRVTSIIEWFIECIQLL